MLRLPTTGAIAVVLLATIAVAAGRAAWSRASSALVARLCPASARGASATAYTEEQIAGLPAPVQRYFRFALRPGQRLIARARLEQRGEFAMSPGKWSAFSATETFNARRPGFVWDAVIRAFGFVQVFVRDSYVAGEGALTAKIAGLFTVADDRATPQMNSGELLRFLAEAVYVPTALLPSEHLQWTALDDAHARATLHDGGLAMSLDYRFDERGAIAAVSGERHYRAPDGSMTLARWVGHWSDYAAADGMQVPRTGDVGWLLSSGPLPYWRGRLVSVDYELE